MAGKIGVAALAFLTASLTAVGGLTIMAAPASAAATTRYVATNGDDTENDCTAKTSPCRHVVYAVGQANAGDTIEIGPGEYQETVRIREPLALHGAGSTGTGRTVIDGDHDGGASVIVDGNDVNQTTAVTIEDVAVSGNPDDDGIQVSGDASLTLRDSTASDNNGIGVDVEAPATATIETSTISGNTSVGVSTFAGQGAARQNARAAAPASAVTISGSVIADNVRDGVAVAGVTATIDHSTIDRNGDGGVVVYQDGTADVTTSTFDANIGAGFVLAAFGNATGHLADSTVANTKPFTTGENQGPVAFGGGVLNLGGALDVRRSTIVANTGQGVLTAPGTTTVANSTVNGTKPSVDQFPSGGVVITTPITPGVRAAKVAGRRFPAWSGAKPAARAAAAPAGSQVTVTGSIVAEQAGKVPDCAGEVTDGGYNLSSDAADSCKFSAAAHDLIKTDPLLGPLANNGGPTQTELLKKGSPAIDAIASGKANCVSGEADQRGVSRPQPVGGACDIGAVELRANKLVIHPNSLHDGTVGDKYKAKITATGGQYPVYVFSLAAGSLPDGLSLSSTGRISGTPTKAGTFHFTVSVNDPVLKDYTIVIADAAPNDNGSEPIAATGTPVLSMTAVGAGALFAGFLLLFGAGLIGRRRARHRVR